MQQYLKKTIKYETMRETAKRTHTNVLFCFFVVQCDCTIVNFVDRLMGTEKIEFDVSINNNNQIVQVFKYSCAG